MPEKTEVQRCFKREVKRMALKTCSNGEDVKICPKIPEIKILPVKFLIEISMKNRTKIIRKGGIHPN